VITGTSGLSELPDAFDPKLIISIDLNSRITHANTDLKRLGQAKPTILHLFTVETAMSRKTSVSDLLGFCSISQARIGEEVAKNTEVLLWLLPKWYVTYSSLV